MPKPGHLTCPFKQRGQGSKLRTIIRVATFLAIEHQPSLSKHAKMLRYGWLRDASPGCQCADRILAFSAELLKDSAPCGITECLEENVTARTH